MKPENEKVKSKNSAWNIGWGWVLTVPAVLFFTWAATRGLRETFQPDDEATMDAVDILKARYAIGDIGRDEFEEKLAGIRLAK